MSGRDGSIKNQVVHPNYVGTIRNSRESIATFLIVPFLTTPSEAGLRKEVDDFISDLLIGFLT
jgi:hypothetical protein